LASASSPIATWPSDRAFLRTDSRARITFDFEGEALAAVRDQLAVAGPETPAPLAGLVLIDLVAQGIPLVVDGGYRRRDDVRSDATARSSTRGQRPVMCRNITMLRGLEPVATPEEITAAARQYVRKVSGVTTVNDATRDAFEAAIAEIGASTARLLETLPARRQPPPTLPPLRRPSVRARIAAKEAAAAAAAQPEPPTAD